MFAHGVLTPRGEEDHSGCAFAGRELQTEFGDCAIAQVEDGYIPFLLVGEQLRLAGEVPLHGAVPVEMIRSEVEEDRGRGAKTVNVLQLKTGHLDH